jgi:hypothetical protein
MQLDALGTGLGEMLGLVAFSVTAIILCQYSHKVVTVFMCICTSSSVANWYHFESGMFSTAFVTALSFLFTAILSVALFALDMIGTVTSDFIIRLKALTIAYLAMGFIFAVPTVHSSVTATTDEQH